jgi:class 3 adenylate cyclase/tetratricopeptide (TPR) repeat protein
MRMKCPRCGHEIPLQSKFCLECGARLARSCAACGTDLPDHAKFCSQCGAPVDAPPAQPSGSAAAPVLEPETTQPRTSPADRLAGSPKTYTPRHLAEKILTSKSALEGERKQVTVLFVDLVESTRLAERLDPEIMHEVMDRVLRLMAEAVHRYEGTVNQFLGDGLMALFGAPLALEDHAVRAVQAALAIRETVSGYSEQLKVQRGVEIKLRIGLNSGPVVVGKIGDDLRMDYTAIGDTTNLAARMQARAEPGTILVTEATHHLIEGYVHSEGLGPIEVKGRGEPVSVFRVTGRRRRRSRFEVSTDRGLTALIGRERELAILRDCLDRAVGGRGQVVGIVGDPGAGKSRLIHEFRRSVASERLTWLEGYCVPYGQATPLLPIVEILSANFGIEEGDNPLQIEEKLRQGLQRLGAGLDSILPFLGQFWGLPGAEQALGDLDPKDKRQKTFEAIRALTFAGSRRRPHVVVIEDMHWIDKTTEEYLAAVVDNLAGFPVLMLTTFRPGYVVPWTDRIYYRQIGIDLLSERDAEELVGTLLGTRNVPPDLIRRVQDKAEGNPLFVEEIIASLRERGLLVRRNGGFVWAKGGEVELPGSVHDIVRARLDRLDEPVKRTVQTAAAIGREFGLNVLRRVSEITLEIDHYLQTLQRLQLIHETRFFPEPEYVFKHAVIQDAAYQSLLTQRRRELHAAIGRAIEELYADRLDDQAPILTYHYARSDHPDRALQYALLAGDRAVRLYANAEATTYYQQAVSLARTLPPSPEVQRGEIDAVLKLATVSSTRQEIERDLANLDGARATAEQLGDLPRLARALYWLGRLEYVRGNPRKGIEYAEQSLQIAEQLNDDALAAPPVNLVGRAYYQLGDFIRASPMLERSAAQMLHLGSKNDSATTAGFACIAFSALGEFDRALALADQGVALADEIGNPFVQAATYFFRAMARGARGEWASGLRDLDEARRLAEGVGDLFRLYVVKVWEGWARTMSGDPSRGRALFEEAISLAERVGTTFVLGRCRAWLAACLLMLGEADGVEALCQAALRDAEQTGDRSALALALRALAETLARRRPPDPEGADGAMRLALQIQEEIGERPELARSYAVYARMLSDRGERERAHQLLAKAIDMFREMGMAWDIAQAQRALSPP